MTDPILQKFFEPERWEYAIDKGVGKDIDKSQLYQLTKPEVRVKKIKKNILVYQMNIDKLAREYAEAMCGPEFYYDRIDDIQRKDDIERITEEAISAFTWLFNDKLA